MTEGRNPPARFVRGSLEKRFFARLVLGDGCWELMGYRDKDGYGSISSGGPRGTSKPLRAHRVSYEMFVGPIPDGLTLDHLCRNRACVNPEHLEPVTHHENIHRGEGLAAQNAQRTHCVNGHEFTPDNTYTRKRQGGGRICKTCIYARGDARRAALRG